MKWVSPYFSKKNRNSSSSLSTVIQGTIKEKQTNKETGSAINFGTCSTLEKQHKHLTEE